MDCVVVRTQDDRLRVTEFRNLKSGDQVACGRRENGEDGIYVHTEAFEFPPHVREKFAFRSHLTRKATTIVCLATQLHSIATGNMTPSYTVMSGGVVRPVYFYTVDMSEFAVSKLADRGSLTARSILTNVQDFVVTVEPGLSKRCA
ncbi:MAG: hypothetical protein WCF40_06215 [Desulfobacterales bacterium]